MNTVDPLLVQTARDVFHDLVDSGAARPPDGEFATQAWRVIAETGLARVGVSQASGGEGGSLADCAAILGLAGEHALPLPLAENAMLAGWLLETAGLALPAESGPAVVAPGRPGDSLSVRRSGAGWIAEGVAARVPWAADASCAVLLAPVAGTASDRVVLVLGRDSYEVRPGRNLAGERRDSVVVTGAHLGAGAVGATAATPAALARLGATSRSVLIAGALRRVLELTVRFAEDRVQFGRPIARFQAVSQLLAQLSEQVALAETAAALAVASAGTPIDDAGIAKAACGRAAGAGSRLAHQVHGAIGVTAEYELQRLTRRLLAWRDEYGSETAWEAELGASLLNAGADSAWDMVIGARPGLAEIGASKPAGASR